MFTGIIEQLGQIKAIEQKPNLIIFKIDMGVLAKGIKLGDSVAVNGVCLTATKKQGRIVSFDLMKETIKASSLKELVKGSRVNLELALKANSRLGGHFVTGHVDEVGVVQSIVKDTNWVAMTITVSAANRKYIVSKGSVTLDGISLTVGKPGKGVFTVYLIPYTLQNTNLASKKKGSLVNIETDILAKYVLRQI